MAEKLIDQLTEKFDITKYKDTYTEKLMRIIEAKASGKTPKAAKKEPTRSTSDDLMSMLKASLNEKRKVG
jgi:DNA end-binding protein Ku